MGLFNRPTEEISSVTAVPALVDTSVIIDGRIVDIAKAGFAPGKLLVPRFVLAELQLISDSGDSMKRSRGRRGLEMLNTMREIGVDMDIIEDDYSDIKEVDAKLVRLGRQLECNVLTTDYNLNRVASIEGVRVLNINELANAVRPVVIPGEYMQTKIVQPGKEKGQGVGYLADGTMIVVDGGDRLMGQDVEVEITRVFQTVAGKMLFAALVKAVNHGDRPAARPNKPATDGTGSAGGGRGRQKGQGRGDGGGKRPNPHQPSRPKPAQPAVSESAQPQNNTQARGRRPRRVSPTQRLEDSLVELTNPNPED